MSWDFRWMKRNRPGTLKHNMQVFVLGSAIACLFENSQLPWESGDSEVQKNPTQKSIKVTNFPFVVYFQLNFPLHAKNYIAICDRILQAFIHERICLRSGINFGHRRVRYTCNQVKYWWLLTSHVVSSLGSSTEVNCSFTSLNCSWIAQWHL